MRIRNYLKRGGGGDEGGGGLILRILVVISHEWFCDYWMSLYPGQLCQIHTYTCIQQEQCIALTEPIFEQK